MNPSTRRALDRVERAMERSLKRSKKPPRRIPLSPFYLVIGLALGYQLLARFVPMVWDGLLQGGLAQASTFTGLPGLVFRLARFCALDPPFVMMVLGGVGLAGFVIAFTARPLRFVVWLAALAVILIDGLILAVTLEASLNSALRDAAL